ncbi:MAG: hypothetical protein LBU27_06460 [Candidatus Peribacteria bacterium]|jgi:hypothetical protein|nr:hypothetical protein [Candidatus Peribacteria bacterium]
MRKLFSLATVGVVLLALSGCGGVNVVDYNDKLVHLQEICYDAESEMMNERDQENYGQVKTLYPTTLATCTQAQVDLAATDAYDGDSALRDAFDAELQLEVAYLQKIGEALTYWDIDELTEEQQTAEDALWQEIDAIETQLATAYEVSETAQKDFAAKHGYELED